MIEYNNQSYKTFTELREKCHLVSEYYIRLQCHCRASVTEKIIRENNIEKYTVVANGKECEVFSDAIIELINKSRQEKDTGIPEDYITQKELVKYLGITLKTLRDMEFWCFAIRDHKKIFYIKGSKKICYRFDDDAKKFYAEKLDKWRHPQRRKAV